MDSTFIESGMREALRHARLAFEEGEPPVGAALYRGGALVSVGRNRREKRQNALWHAELEAIHGACEALGSWRLEDCTLFVTLEPCPMCAGAVISARIPSVVFGARDERAGACGSVLDLFSERFGHRPAVLAGVLGDECAELLTRFFYNIRQEVET